MAEGIRFVGEIPKDWPVECYVVSASYAAEYDITELEKRAEVYVLTDHLFADVAETENPQGIMTICGVVMLVILLNFIPAIIDAAEDEKKQKKQENTAG